LRRTIERQTSGQLSYLRKERLFHFRATEINKSRSYKYVANVNETSAKVVSAYANKKNPKGQGYVRHHAASFRFERLQPRSGDVVRVGVIGTEDTVGGFTEFLAETARGIESGNKQLINLNPDFPDH